MSVQERISIAMAAMEETEKLIRELEGNAEELAEVRATLMVNFGPPGVRSASAKDYGFTLHDDGKKRTTNMLLLVLRSLTDRIEELKEKLLTADAIIRSQQEARDAK